MRWRYSKRWISLPLKSTRHSATLLNHYAIPTKLTALHEHNERTAGEKLIAQCKAGQSVALISDAGTPAISDPGALLVNLRIKPVSA